MQTLKRCSWCLIDPLYIAYHDEEWGKKITDENLLFEFLILESAQAGLSWFTILKRRENYRKAFANFDPNKVALFTEKDVSILVKNPGIIRHIGKIRASITNAQIFLKIQSEQGSFYNYLYSFMPSKKETKKQNSEIFEAIAKNISKDMKKRGFKFFGPTICYAYMQAIGMVNDHDLDCSFR